MEMTHAGLVEIEQSEGWSSVPYWDSYGKCWTQGFGQTRGVTKDSKPITRAQGEADLIASFKRDYAWALEPFEKLEGFTQNMYDALGSFIWNCGPGAVGGGSTIGRHLRARRWQQAADSLLAWCRAGGVVLQGLLARRKRERALFLKAVVVVDKRVYLTPWEKETVSVLEHERRIAQRHKGWDKVDGGHLVRAAKAKGDLIVRVKTLKAETNQKKYHRADRIAVLEKVIANR